MTLGLFPGFLELHLKHLQNKEPFPRGMCYILQGYTDRECAFNFKFHTSQYQDEVLSQRLGDIVPEILSPTRWFIEISPLITAIKIPCEVVVRLSHLVPLDLLVAMDGASCTNDNLMFALQGFRHFFEANTVNHHIRQDTFLRLNRHAFKSMMANLHQQNPEVWRMLKLMELPELCPSHFD